MLVAPLSHFPIKGSWFLKGQFILESDILFFNHPVRPLGNQLTCRSWVALISADGLGLITDQRKQICWKSTFMHFTEIICSQLELFGGRLPLTTWRCSHFMQLHWMSEFADLDVNAFLFVTVPLTLSPCTWVSLHHAPWGLACITEYLNRGAHGVESNPGKFPFVIYSFLLQVIKEL